MTPAGISTSTCCFTSSTAANTADVKTADASFQGLRTRGECQNRRVNSQLCRQWKEGKRLSGVSIA